MAYYESICILRSSVPDDEASQIIEKMKGSLEKQGAAILKVDNWGKRKLAYEVGHDRRGFFVLFQFEAKGKAVAELERLYRLEDSVLKFMTVAVDKEFLMRDQNSEATAVATPVSVAADEMEPDGGGV